MYTIEQLPPQIRARTYHHENDCWLWQGAQNSSGYASKWWDGKVRSLHVVIYELLVAPLEQGQQLDHIETCKYKNCLNPTHMEPVTQAENLRRGSSTKGARRTHCANGHPVTLENTYRSPAGVWECKVCRRATKRRFDERRRRYGATL